MLKEFIKIFSMTVMLLIVAVFGQSYFSMVPVPIWLYVYMLLLLAGASAMLAYVITRCGKAETQVVFEQRFRNILENIELLSVGMDTQFRIAFCNDALLKVTGTHRKNIIGKNWFEVFVPTDKHVHSKEILYRIISREYSSSHYEGEIQSHIGERYLIEWNISKMFDPLGQIIGVTLIGKNITKERQSKEELHKIKRAIEQSPSTVMIVDTVGRIEYVNPKFIELTGYTLEEVIGQNPRILKSGETTQEEYKKLWETIMAGDEWRGTLHNRKKNGELYWEEALISPVRNSDGEITHFLAVKEDITERKRLENAVKQGNFEIAKNEALTTVGRMANMIAHDLRNPLSSIKMGLQILGDRPTSDWHEEEHELKQIALDQVDYMEDILADLMSYSRPDAINPEWLQLDELLDMVLIHIQREINEQHVQVEIHYQPRLPKIYADARKLRQIFTNVISNAIQASSGLDNRVSEISIRVKQIMSADILEVSIEITDNGHGLDPEIGGRLFEPFYTTRSKGTGLGLAIVRRFVEQHDGTVCLEPAENGGTKVTIVLPTKPAEYKQIEGNKKMSVTG